MERYGAHPAMSYERAADFWDSEGRPDKAQAERSKARDERRAAEAQRTNPQADTPRGP